jgi:hypothetical protein
MRKTRVIQMQMTMSFWHTTRPIISDEFLVLMVHFGGCAPFPQPLDHVDPVLVIAHGNHCKLLQEEETPYFLLVPPPEAFSTEHYTEWMGTVDNLGFTFTQLRDTIEYFSRQADLGPATGDIVALPGFRSCRYCMSLAVYGRRHPWLKYIEVLRAFHALPSSQRIIQFYEPTLPVVEHEWMTRLLTIPSNLPAQLPTPRAPPTTGVTDLRQFFSTIPTAPTAADIHALSTEERKIFVRQQEIDRRAFQEGDHWLKHVSDRYTEKASRWTSDRVVSDATLGLPTAAPALPLSPFPQPKVPNTYGAGRLAGTAHKCFIDVTANAPSRAETSPSLSFSPTTKPLPTLAQPPSRHKSLPARFSAPYSQTRSHAVRSRGDRRGYSGGSPGPSQHRLRPTALDQDPRETCTTTQVTPQVGVKDGCEEGTVPGQDPPTHQGKENVPRGAATQRRAPQLHPLGPLSPRSFHLPWIASRPRPRSLRLPDFGSGTGAGHRHHGTCTTVCPGVRRVGQTPPPPARSQHPSASHTHHRRPIHWPHNLGFFCPCSATPYLRYLCRHR